MIKSFELFNLDKKGNPITWSISYDDSSNWYTMSSGRVGGAITTTEPTYCEGKNQGLIMRFFHALMYLRS